MQSVSSEQSKLTEQLERLALQAVSSMLATYEDMGYDTKSKESLDNYANDRLYYFSKHLKMQIDMFKNTVNKEFTKKAN